MKTKLTYIFYVTLICLFLQCVLASEESKYFFCNGRIYASDPKIDLQDINELCQRINSDYRFLIVIKKNIPDHIPALGVELDNYITRDSEDFFSRKCRDINKKICDYGFMISIYSSVRKVRITAGSVSKHDVTVDMRNNIINSIRNLLSKQEYDMAIFKAIDMLQSYSQYNNNNSNISNPSYIPPTNNNTKKESSSGTSFLLIFVFIICPLFLCCFYYAYKKNTVYSQQGNSAEDIHRHLNEIENLLQDVKRNNPPVMSINKCVICMKQIQMQSQNPNPYNTLSTTQHDNYMQSNLIVRDPNHTRFACGHVFHNICLNDKNLTACLMCVGNVQSSMVIPNTHEAQVVDEGNIKNLIQNLHLIYEKENLQDYARTYPNEYDSYNNNLALGLGAVWGVTAIATAAYMMSDMNTYNTYNISPTNQNFNNINNYNNNEMDTAEGDF